MRWLAALIILALTIAWPGPPAAASITRAATIYDVYSRVTGSVLYRNNVTNDFRFDLQAIGPLAVTFNRGAPDRFYHSDAQGSRLAFSNSAGVVGARERYTPFGERLLNGAGMGNFITYTGHMRDVDTGLNYMQARFYDPVIGRFLSTDPIGYQDQLNLYAYVANDPVNKIDPTGEYIESLIDVGLIAADIVSIASDGFTAANTASLAGNLVGLALPGATGVGVAARGAVTAVKAADKAKDAAKAGASAERAKNIEKGIPESKLGPSGKPKQHTVQHSTRKEAQQTAKQQADKAGGSVRNDANPANPKQGPHFQAEDAKGQNVTPVVHHEYPD